jgi:SAM-dependent methyltransferase
MASGKIEGELWGGRARDWAELGEPTCRSLFDAMLEAANVGPGMKFLDMGCGAGGACVRASARGAEVSGFDASANLLEIARERLPDAEFRQGDIEQLPYEDGTFDVVFAANSVQYADDQERAVREALRVKLPEGVLVIGMWCEPDRCQMAPLFKALAPPQPPEGAPPTLSAKENLLDLLRRSGAKIEEDGEVLCKFEFDNQPDLLRGIRSAGIMQMLEEKLGEQFVIDAVTDSLAPCRNADGSYAIDNWFRWVVCR